MHWQIKENISNELCFSASHPSFSFVRPQKYPAVLDGQLQVRGEEAHRTDGDGKKIEPRHPAKKIIALKHRWGIPISSVGKKERISSTEEVNTYS